MSNVNELVVTAVLLETSRTTGNTYAMAVLKQVAGVSVTGSVKFKMENGSPLTAKRICNINEKGETSLNAGDVFDGTIIKVKTTPYLSRDGKRTVESFTVPVFDGESAIDNVNKAFTNLGVKACALDSKGLPTMDLKTEVTEPAIIVDEAQ